VLVYVAALFDIAGIGAVGWAGAGIFTAQFLFGLAWACLGAYLGRRIGRRGP
jgi:hypothetical protein